MLTIKCASCKTKLFKYRKIGSGDVLRCHKDRISKAFHYRTEAGKLLCACGRVVGDDVGTCFKMRQSCFTSSGTKDTK
jgi:hypothetical protein